MADEIATVRRFQPRSADDRLRLRESLDPEFARSVLNYTAGLLSRPHLDTRTRLLVLAGQFTITRYPGRLRDIVAAAISEDVNLREVLEAILQCSIYGGETLLDEALEAFAEVVEQHDRMDDLAPSRPPIDHDARDLEQESTSWQLDDPDDPRLEPYLEKYGWRAVSTGLRLRGTHALNSLEFYDGFDEEFGRLWQEHAYHRTYSRTVLDDKTRLLCVVGDLLAIREGTQSREHMRGALRAGARPRELMEVAIQGSVLFGHPNMRATMSDIMDIVHELGLTIDSGPLV